MKIKVSKNSYNRIIKKKDILTFKAQLDLFLDLSTINVSYIK